MVFEESLKFCPEIGAAMMDSGSWKLVGQEQPSSRPRMVSGLGWIEEEVVKAAASGDMMGDPFCEFEATDEPLMEEMGSATDVCVCVEKCVCTWPGPCGFDCERVAIVEVPRGVLDL
jgi:hypothetical protein